MNLRRSAMAATLVTTTEENGIDSAGIEHKLRALLGL
jgi:hypothetical protein